VRFANPEYDDATETYCLDIEFQSDTPGKQLFIMNVRFFYDDDVLEFGSLGEFEQGYGPVNPNPPIVTTLPTSYSTRWGFSGPPEYVNGSVQRISSSPIYISTTEWTKLFNICFHVDDPDAMTEGDFCPSIVWDLKEDGSGGFLAGTGVTITVEPPSPAIGVTENVVQFNWVYDGVSGYPYGYPEYIECISARVAPTTKILSCLANGNDYVTFPILVWNFVDITSFSLTVDFDPAVLEYCCVVPHAGVEDNFTTTLVYPGRISMASDGFFTSLEDETTIIYATFKYIEGSCCLMWSDDGSSCEYVDGNTNMPLPDMPTATFYFDGNVTPGEFIWTGASSTDWNEAANWQGSLVPGAFDHVTITASPLPPHWPTFDGDFRLGEQCRDLILEGYAEITITGDFTIDPGCSLDIINSGVVKVGGDWINSGTFNPGTGEIEFIGNQTGTISQGVPPEDYVAGYEHTTFAVGITPVTGGSAGPTGDNSHSDVNIGFSFTYLGVAYTQVRVNTNGWLSFNLSGTDAESHDNTLLFDNTDPTTVLAPWWDDLLADGSSAIKYQTEGVEPNRIFIVEWNNILAYSSGSTTRLNFQVKLYESTDIIEFCYGDASSGTHNDNEGASMGIKDATGGSGNFMDAKYGSTHLMIGCLRSDVDWPDANYRFSPPQEDEAEEFHHLTVSKETGILHITTNVIVTGTD
jgi:hypothetical protein